MKLRNMYVSCVVIKDSVQVCISQIKVQIFSIVVDLIIVFEFGIYLILGKFIMSDLMLFAPKFNYLIKSLSLPSQLTTEDLILLS